MNEALSPDALYTLREARRYLRISDATARRWIKDGRLRGRKIGRDYRVRGRDLLECLGEESQPPLRIFGPDNPMLKLAGIGDSGLTDVADEHDRYLDEILRDEWR